MWLLWWLRGVGHEAPKGEGDVVRQQRGAGGDDLLGGWVGGWVDRCGGCDMVINCVSVGVAWWV